MGNKNRKCIIKHYFYNLYYNDRDSYGNNPSDAKIYNENEVPENLKNNHKNEIIFLDTEKGLELLIGEIERLKKLLVEKDNSNQL
jgi:hypothetical protein